MQERRKLVRVETPVLIEFPHPQTKKSERSFTVDVSESGMRFPTTVPFRMGDGVTITLQLPLSDPVMPVKATVVWVREVARYAIPQFEVGVRFEWIHPKDRERFAGHLAQLLGH
jgi:Tfp pilus assembly protein PilZ